MSLPGLYAVLDAEVAAAHGWTLADLARAVLDGGAQLLQVRAKASPSANLLSLSRSIVALAEPYGARVVVNDRPDIATLAAAAGVHLGQDDLTPEDARAIVGADAIVGLSTHTAAQVADAAARPVSYIAVGPVFATRTKDTGFAPVGLDLVRRAAETGRPVVAIGGITLDQAAAVLAAGATSLAVIADLLVDRNPAARVRAWVDATIPDRTL